MKQISNLTGTIADKPDAIQTQQSARVTQSQAGFWRRVEIIKSGILLKSSTGGLVHVPWTEIWNVAEKADANLITPKTS